jgi:hypothetical protein
MSVWRAPDAGDFEEALDAERRLLAHYLDEDSQHPRVGEPRSTRKRSLAGLGRAAERADQLTKMAMHARS